MEVTINQEQQIYVINRAEGVSCWGFKNAFEETMLLAQRLSRPELIPTDSEFGKLTVLDKHRSLIDLARAAGDLGTWFRASTPDKVKRIINRLIHTDEVVRLFCGDPQTGKMDVTDFEVMGRVGRSGGILKVPLLLEEDSGFGGPIPDDRILRIIRVSDRKVLYSAPAFVLPTFSIFERDDKDYPYGVNVDGVLHAGFSTYAKACAWVAFMAGESFCQPDA